MLYTQKTLAALEYDKILALLADRALTEGARERALTLLPSEDYDTVCMRQNRTQEARKLLSQKGYPPLSGVEDISGAIERADKGATLSTREILAVARVFSCARALLDYRNEPTDGSLDALSELFAGLVSNRSFESRIGRAILSEEMIADEASPELADIRRKIRAENNRIKDSLQKYVSGGYSRFLQENIVTMRDGRYVIPVKTEYRNEVKGLVHDTSSSGSTVFIEPMSVVEANNELRMLLGKEQREVERILSELSALCAEYGTTALRNYRNITELALYFTCASLAESMHAERPNILPHPQIRLHRARHPLLHPETVVPIDVTLGETYRTLIITGPNTGGKTVTLKTLGLFVLMAQAGLQIPASADSSVGIFREVLVDIGDEQSIEQSLSTFSSHMVNIVSMLSSVTEGSLVLFDELGAGTDPVEGAALAGAILEEVRNRNALTAATTHYAELKAYALETPGVQNASCEFDLQTLRPTYRLIIGAPGKSNAFAISVKLGLDPAIVDRAEKMLSGNSKRFESVIEKLENSRVEMEKNRAEAERMREEYEIFKRTAEKKLKEKLAGSQKEIEKNMEKARQTLESARATSEFVLKELEAVRKKQDSHTFGKELNEARRRMREKLQETSDAVYAGPGDLDPDEPYRLPRDLRIGDKVYLPDFGQTGRVQELPDRTGHVSVRAGILSAKVALDRVRLLEGDAVVREIKADSAKHSRTRSGTGSGHAVYRDFRPEIDVRGMYGEDAWNAVDKYLDEAILSGIQSVRIIHGKGTGALRTALQNDLHHDPRVRSYRNGAYGEGDLGVTVVELK